MIASLTSNSMSDLPLARRFRSTLRFPSTRFVLQTDGIGESLQYRTLLPGAMVPVTQHAITSEMPRTIDFRHFGLYT